MQSLLRANIASWVPEWGTQFPLHYLAYSTLRVSRSTTTLTRPL